MVEVVVAGCGGGEGRVRGEVRTVLALPLALGELKMGASVLMCME